MTGMANEPVSPNLSAAPAPVAAAPVSAAPVTAPAPSVTVAPVVESAPVAQSPTTEITAPVESAPTVAAESVVEAKPADETILGADEKKPEEIKPEESAKDKAAEGEKKDGSQSDEPAPLPSFEPFEAPEGITLDDVAISAFTKELGEFELASKADHAEVAKLGQSLLTKHVAAIQDTVQKLQKAYEDAWAKQTQDWRTQFESDAEIGGNHKDTTVNAARESIRRFGGTETQQKEFRDLMQKTGLGNHPAMIRMLANINLAKAEGKIIPASTPVAQPKGKMQKMYGVGPKK
jgi:hypothetical protein